MGHFFEVPHTSALNESHIRIQPPCSREAQPAALSQSLIHTYTQ